MVCLHRLWLHTYRPKFWWWFAVMCGGFGGLWWFAVVCLLVIPCPASVNHASYHVIARGFSSVVDDGAK